MNETHEYIKNTIISCKARRYIYYQYARRWSRLHWWSGIINGCIASGISLLSFMAQRQGFSNTEVGMVGGLVLGISNSISTSLKAGQNQSLNEKAGDEYRRLEEKIKSKYCLTLTEQELKELKNYCIEKLDKLINKYNEPDPEYCEKLEKKFRSEIELNNQESV